ncbi:MAG: phospholipid carrier-dependent glycosyltransferase [Chloroflexi bacterium]|nr:phospholipid carrier-dependent glycosyltransferase [Chloroflexota bacterium]
MTRPARSDAGTDRSGIIALLVLGLALRFIIAYLLPGSGFKVDIDSFQFWSGNLAANGPGGFYDRPFFHDYTPGYLYVLWLMGVVTAVIGHPVTILGSTFTSIDLLKLPPVLGDLAIAYLAWSMSRELGASERNARIAALIVVVNPVTWFDSVLWGQVDSVGVVVLLLALRELWRDRPERSAVLAMLAALVKPQLGILIPIVAAVTIRRALWPDGRYGHDDPDAITSGGATSWERRVTGPIRILTTGAAGLLTAILLSLPFGLSLPGLIAQLFKTAAGYPYVSVNAYNPWALVSQNGHGIASDHAWVCDSTIAAGGPTEFRIGPFVIPDFGSPGSTFSCPDGFMVGALPAAVVGMGLFLLVGALIVWLVARRPDRRTMLVGLAVLSLAFFVLPTRVHERYLFPLVGVAAIVAGVSLRWRVAYIVASMAMLANMYAVLTTLYPGNPGISDWLKVGDVLTSWSGVAAAAIAQFVVFVWACLQLREDASEELQAEIEGDIGGGPGDRVGGGRRNWLERTWDRFGGPAGPAGLAPPLVGARDVTAPLAAGRGPSDGSSAAPTPRGPDADVALMPAWDDRDGAAAGPLGWVKARFFDRPIRADLSGALAHEAGGKLDKLDLWIVLVLVASLATVRIWRLAEPYDMHFDEVYHPRTATEFLQLWRYGMSHDIYEWTHPHLAKYAMAVGIMALGDDKTTATADLGLPGLRDAEVETRWDDAAVHARSGDRLWLAGDGQVRAYDLATRDLIATWSVPGVTAISVDGATHRLFIGTANGDILTIDTAQLDSLRATNTPAQPNAGTSGAPAPTVDALAWTTVGAAIDRLHAAGDGAALEVVTGDVAAAQLITIDAASTAETGRLDVADVTAIVDHGSGSVVVADAAGVQFVDTSTGAATATVRLDGRIGGLTGTSGLNDNPLYASYLASDGPMLAMVVAGTGTGDARVTTQFRLPGDAAGPVAFDAASKMLHAVGTSPGDIDRGSGSRATVYVVNPNGTPAANSVYADAQLPFDATAIAMDDAQQYPSSDRQQLLAFSADGRMATVPIGRHAFAWRLPGVLAGILMAALIYLLARLLFRRREVAVILAILVAADGLLFVQSRIGMNDAYVGLFIIAAYTLFTWLWLRPGGTRRHWIAWAIGMPILGVILGLALASKWVAAYAIGGMGILILGRSALGRVLVGLGLVAASAVLGYIAISVPEGAAGGNYMFLAIMVALTVVAVVAAVLHPIGWTWEEQRLAIFGPIAIGGLGILGTLATGHLSQAYTLGPLTTTPLVAGFAAIALGVAMYSVFFAAGRFGFGPMAVPPRPDDPAAVLLDAPSPAPTGWLNLGSGFGLPAFFTLACLVGIPIIVYVISYIPWAFVGQDQLWPGWPPGHTGQTLVDLTQAMYSYHNNLTSPHPATSPWWAWPLDLKPVWFYQDSFAGNTSASIYDAGNLVSWWLAIPAMAFVAYQSFKRRSVALALVTIAFATQWLAWARIDRAAFQYHYYTALPFLLIASAYLIAELWNGPSWRTWVMVRLAGATAVLLPFGLWLLHRPLCGIAGVSVINPGSQACPTTIPDVALSPRAIGIAVVVGLGVLFALRLLLSHADEDAADADVDWPDADRRTGRFRAKLVRAGLIVVVAAVAFTAITLLVPPTSVFKLRAVPVEPIALIVTIALLPVAAFVATARDARRFAAGMLLAIGLWFVVWYPNISALPLPSGLTNVFQGFLPTYLYPFQFWVNTTPRASGPLDWKWIAMLLALIGGLAAAVFYSTASWRLALAERRAQASGPRPVETEPSDSLELPDVPKPPDSPKPPDATAAD